MLEQISDPFRIFDIRLAPWNGLDVLSIDDEDLQMTLSQVVDGFPKHAGTFPWPHGYKHVP